ncbi:DUF1015 domain-containing protein [Lutibacter sp.]
MATIKPFKAVRPTRDKAALATSRSYEIYTKKELKAQLKYNPFSFLHIIKPGYSSKSTPIERFNAVKKAYHSFKKEHIYKKDKNACYYLHQKKYNNDVFWGIIAITHVKDYQTNIVKKHEDTLHEREQLFGDYLDVVGFNAEPVLLTYPENTVLNNIYKKYASYRAEYEFITQTKRLHKLWIIDTAEDIKNIELEFRKMNEIYIADGHHRCASSNYLANKYKSENKNHTGTENYNFFMSYLISDNNLKISEFNRFVKDLNGLTKEAFLEKLSKFYIVKNKGTKLYKPTKKHHFSMYLEGEYYSLHLKNIHYKINNALSDLDTHILHKTVLKPILGIGDLKTDRRIKCIYTASKNKPLKKEVDSGNFKIGFGLFPVSVNQLKAVADEGLTMPPKSTYIEPKLRSGLTIFEIHNS